MRELQSKIIRQLDVRPTIDPMQEITARRTFLKEYLTRSAMCGYVLGVSGGQDSLLAGILAQQAVEEARSKGHEATFHAVLLPYGEQADRKDALLAIKTISPDVVHELNIKSATDAFAASFLANEGEALPDYHRGNVKARMRMIAQYALAGTHKAIVIGTDHAAEAVTGFYTKYGDGGADILPLAGLNKRQGRSMLASLTVPERFITKTPTADLLDNQPSRPDENELGVAYDTIDDYLEGKVVPEEYAKKIEHYYISSAHKRAMPVAYTR